MDYFCSAFPVTCIDGLGEGVEAREGVQLTVVNHVIFDVFCKTIVSLSKHSAVSPHLTCVASS